MPTPKAPAPATRTRGRKPLPPDLRKIQRSIGLTQAQWDTLIHHSKGNPSALIAAHVDTLPKPKRPTKT